MSLHFHWFLPTNGDGRDIVGGGHGVATGSEGAIRPASLGYLGQVARSAEQLGFEAALTPTGAWCEDAWLVTGMLTEITERLNFLDTQGAGGAGVQRIRWQHPAPGSADDLAGTTPFALTPGPAHPAAVP